MERYFDTKDRAALYSGGKIETTLELITNRYIGVNPQYDYTARPFLPGEIIRNKDYRYSADFAQIFPSAPNGSYVYVWGKYWAKEGGELKFTLIPKGPAKIWMNQIQIFATDVVSERYDNTPQAINLPLKKGWNHIVLRFTRTKAGFGGEFGTWLGKLLEFDAFILNEDRHLHNIAVILKPDESFRLMPVFDNGAAFISDTRRDYPLTVPTVQLIDKVRCKPIVTHFGKQLEAVREVVGLSLKLERDVRLEAEPIDPYDDLELGRVKQVISIQSRRYPYLF